MVSERPRRRSRGSLSWPGCLDAWETGLGTLGTIGARETRTRRRLPGKRDRVRPAGRPTRGVSRNSIESIAPDGRLRRVDTFSRLAESSAAPAPIPAWSSTRAGRIAVSWNRQQSRQSATRRATRRTRRVVLSVRRFRSTAGMDSGDMNTRVSGALCGRRSEGTAFASCAARRTQGTSGKK